MGTSTPSMASGATSSQLGSTWPCRLAGAPFPQEDDVGDDPRALALEGVRRQADRPEEVGPGGEVLADGGVLLVEREVGGDQGQDAAGLQGVERLGEEEVVEREPRAAVLELHVGERRVADDGVDAALGQPRVAEVLDADVVAGVEGLGDAARERIELDADEAHALGGEPQEIARAAARLEHGRVLGDAEAGQRLEHRRDDRGRGVEGVEGGASGTRRTPRA